MQDQRGWKNYVKKKEMVIVNATEKKKKIDADLEMILIGPVPNLYFQNSCYH